MRVRGALLALLLLLVPGVWAEFAFNQVELSRDGDQFVLNASIGFELNATTIEALDNGVPLTIETHIQLRRVGAWVWEPDIVEHRLRQTLTLDPLSSLYEVKELRSGDVRRFATRDAALGAMGELQQVALVSAASLDPNEHYRVELRSFLDVEALPLPLRPLAHLSSEWGLESEVWQAELPL